jgi:hypothetical protein
MLELHAGAKFLVVRLPSKEDGPTLGAILRAGTGTRTDQNAGPASTAIALSTWSASSRFAASLHRPSRFFRIGSVMLSGQNQGPGLSWDRTEGLYH